MSSIARRVAVLERKYHEAVVFPTDEWIIHLPDDDAEFLENLIEARGVTVLTTYGHGLPEEERARLVKLLEDMRLFVAERIRKATTDDRGY